MLQRYSRKAMADVWSDESKFHHWLLVEITVLRVRHELGELSHLVPEGLEDQVLIDPKEINRIEKEKTGHDVVAFLEHVSPQIPEELRPWMHRGLTSYDIGDTTFGLQMRESIDIIIQGVEDLMEVLKERAYEFQFTPEIGRTHGINAEPITFGVKLTNWYAEIDRHLTRLKMTRDEVSVGKISGAVGMYTLPPCIEEAVCTKLGLRPIIATQIISRDIVAVFMSTLANLAGSLGKITTNLRLLSQTEIGEVMEPFGKQQKGSSAMPHKKNPIGSENISGLARLPGAHYIVALENLANCWHERSLDNSGSERVIIPDSALLIDYTLGRLTGIIKGMRVFPERMMRNIYMTKGLVFSQEVMMLVAEKSQLPREEAHTLVRDIAVVCYETESDFLEALLDNDEVMRYVSEDELGDCFQLEKKLKHVDYIFKKVFG